VISRPSISAFFSAAIAFLMISRAHAAVRTWSGAGVDANWNTPGNWGGTAPVNADALVFSGTTQPNNTNNISNLSVNGLQIANGGFTLNGNLLALNGPVTNSMGTNLLALPVNVTVQNPTWNIAPGSELRFTGPFTNSTTANPLATLAFGGTVRFASNNCLPNRFFTLTSGAVIADGCNLATLDGFRLQPPAGSTAVFQITNNASFTIGSGGNLRLCQTATGGSSRVDMSSGVLNLAITSGANAGDIFVGEAATTTTVFNQNGGLVEFTGNGNNRIAFANASATADGTYNLNAGVLWTKQIVQVTTGAPGGTFNFNGGTLKPTTSSAAFFTGVQTANILSGGAIIDTTNLNITIGQVLGGSGSLTKIGTGTLTLSGANTYAGTTTISNGTLLVNGQNNGSGAVNVAGGIFGGTGSIAGAVVVQANGTFSPGVGVGAMTLQSDLALAGTIFLEVDKSQAASNDFVQVDGALTNPGACIVSITNLGPIFTAGDQFQFFNKPMLNGDAVQFSPPTPGTGMVWTNRLAMDGSVGIVTAPIIATPADLIGLTLSDGTLSPGFSSNLLSYSAHAAYSNSAVAITPTAANASATIRVICNGATNVVGSGNPATVALKSGANTIDVQVTAPDNSITQDYIVTFTRVPPNIVLILADDQGFSDWSCYGGEIATPNLDRLASEGLRFRQFYNCARCSPTRCAVLTGLYTAQVAVDPSQALPNLRNDNNVTIAELLGANGYRTYMAGKWHLGNGALLPEARGFQEVWRYADGTAHSEDTWNTNLYKLVSSDGEITNRIYPAGTFYQPDSIGDYSLDFINNALVTHTNDKPFFLYMPFGSAHFPIQAPQDWVNTNVPIYSAGWDAVRNSRFTNMLAQGVLGSGVVLSPNEGTAPWTTVPAEAIPDWTTFDPDRQADLARRMAIYAAMVQKMDANIGRVVAQLRAAGRLDNTLIFALSDNGGNYEGAVLGQTGGVPDAAPLTGTSLTNMGLNGQPIIYLGGGWAHVSDTPFRLFKHFNHEGGIRTPLIVHWPEGLSRTNQWENEPGHVIDLMSTIVDVTGVSYPTQFNGHVVLPLEGQSLRPLFTGTNEFPRALGFEHESNRAWLSGSWKFVTKNFTAYDGSRPANQLELYDLSKDPTELTNLADAQPRLLGQLVTNWNTWATRVGVPSSRLVNPGQLIPPVFPATNASDLFVDTFNRPDETNIDESAAGMWGSRVPPLGVEAAYYEGFEGSGLPTSIQILSSNLQMAVGVGMSENGIMHNFTGQDIVDAGGFSVELTVQDIDTDSSDAANRYVGFGVGLSQAEAAAGGDINDNSAILFRGKQGNANLGVSDFFVELDMNGNIKVWSNGVLLDTVSVGQAAGTLTASFACTGFTTDDIVTVNVFFNGLQVDINTADANSMSRTFKWDRNNSNYIGLSARASNFTQMDNLAIRKLPLAGGAAINYAMQYGLSGTNADADADPDGDGVSNFAEWAFGGDPSAADPFIAGLKGAMLTPTQDFQFTYQRLINAANYGLRYRYFVSEDLSAWTETTPTQVSASTNEDKAGYEIVTLQLPASLISGKNKLFLRVLAEPVN
jgi:autotransporter-associated beta strand protein